MKAPKPSPTPAPSRNRLKFMRLAEKRVNKVAKQLQLIGNLSNRTNYAYTPDEVERMFEHIEACVAAARERFAESPSGPAGPFHLNLPED